MSVRPLSLNREAAGPRTRTSYAGLYQSGLFGVQFTLEAAMVQSVSCDHLLSIEAPWRQRSGPL